MDLWICGFEDLRICGFVDLWGPKKNSEKNVPEKNISKKKAQKNMPKNLGKVGPKSLEKKREIFFS